MREIKSNFIPELLAPAGDLERLRFAYIYGADAAYVGAGGFSLRNSTGFSLEKLAQAREIADAYGRKLYVAVNIFADNRDLTELCRWLPQLGKIQPDALIVSDPAVFQLGRELLPQMPLHISTQANVTNWRAARFWAEQGAARVVLARELSLEDGAIVAELGGVETEIFVHGALCIAYSGRCLLSNYLADRSANQGQCCQPCRWRYALQEETRPGQFMPIEEDSRGSYILNSKDLCLLQRIPQLLAAGFSSWKIEGRNKSPYYVATIVRTYRAARDAALREGADFQLRPGWQQELDKISHRGYTENFALSAPGSADYRREDGYIRGYDFAAVLQRLEDGRAYLEQRNHFASGDKLEVLLPAGGQLELPIADLRDEDGLPTDAARHPFQRVSVLWPQELGEPTLPLVCRKNCL